MPILDNNELSPREHILMENERDEARLTREYAITIKRLELEVKRADNDGKIKLKELESKWSSWLKIPITIIRLPLYIIMGIAYCIAMIRKYEPSKNFWELMK